MSDDIQHLLVQLAAAKAAEEKLASLKVEIQNRLIDAFEQTGKTNASATLDNGDVIKGTLVKAERVIIHEDTLKKAIGAPKWNKVTKQVLDKTLLEAAVAMGVIDANVVADNSEVVVNKPFVKITGKVRDAATLTSDTEVAITNSVGQLKPAARRRVVKPKG